MANSKTLMRPKSRPSKQNDLVQGVYERWKKNRYNEQKGAPASLVPISEFSETPAHPLGKVIPAGLPGSNKAERTHGSNQWKQVFKAQPIIETPAEKKARRKKMLQPIKASVGQLVAPSMKGKEKGSAPRKSRSYPKGGGTAGMKQQNMQLDRTGRFEPVDYAKAKRKKIRTKLKHIEQREREAGTRPNPKSEYRPKYAPVSDDPKKKIHTLKQRVKGLETYWKKRDKLEGKEPKTDVGNLAIRRRKWARNVRERGESPARIEREHGQRYPRKHKADIFDTGTSPAPRPPPESSRTKRIEHRKKLLQLHNKMADIEKSVMGDTVQSVASSIHPLAGTAVKLLRHAIGGGSAGKQATRLDRGQSPFNNPGKGIGGKKQVEQSSSGGEFRSSQRPVNKPNLPQMQGAAQSTPKPQVPKPVSKPDNDKKAKFVANTLMRHGVKLNATQVRRYQESKRKDRGSKEMNLMELSEERTSEGLTTTEIIERARSYEEKITLQMQDIKQGKPPTLLPQQGAMRLLGGG